MEEETHDLVKQGSELGGRNAWHCQTGIRMGSKKRMAWSDKDRCNALSFYSIRHKAAMLVKTIFALPTVSTPRRATREIKIQPGFCHNILSALQKKVSSMPSG